MIYPKYPNCKNNNRCSWTSCSDDIGFIKNIIDLTKEITMTLKKFMY